MRVPRKPLSPFDAAATTRVGESNLTEWTRGRNVGAFLWIAAQPGDIRVVLDGAERGAFLIDAAAAARVLESVLLFRAVELDLQAQGGVMFPIVDTWM